MGSDAFDVLGLGPGASEADVRAARRRLAKALHPDVSPGDGDRMREVNRAAEEALALVRRGSGPAREVVFSVDALPVEACQRLLAAVAVLGEVLDADEPYRIEGFVADPGPCFVTLELVPEAGGSIVTLSVDGEGEPPAGAVLDALVAELA